MAAPAPALTFKMQAQQALAARELKQRLRHEAIAARAYAIYESEGAVDGNHERHWYQAVHEVAREAQVPQLSATVAR